MPTKSAQFNIGLKEEEGHKEDSFAKNSDKFLMISKKLCKLLVTKYKICKLEWQMLDTIYSEKKNQQFGKMHCQDPI